MDAAFSRCPPMGTLLVRKLTTFGGMGEEML